MPDNKELQAVADLSSRLRTALKSAIVGQAAAVEHVMVALVVGGHVLLTGGAATAKGLLVQCLARTATLAFKRIQFTPDLMPSDITGAEILEEESGSSKRVARFVPGPIFTNLLMADEINRTPPKTQAALLEAMQEKQVTTGGMTRPLPKPFFVMATKTSLESDGTYPLPEAQQDRFMLDVEMETLSEAEEVQVVTGDATAQLARLPQIIEGAGLLRFQQTVRSVAMPQPVKQYIVNLTAASRPGTPDATEAVNKYVAWGAGVRASQYLALGAKARAALEGRDAASVADVKAVALPVMRHRIGVNFRAENDNVKPAKIVGMLLEHVKT
ncbi:MAG: AAA family ATPase [Planctomycetota bacterium]|nr:AAA family ATPase [Planctomycetota bacterium]